MHRNDDDDDDDMIEHDEPASEQSPLLVTRSISEHELVPTVHSPRMILLILSFVAFVVVFALNLFTMPSERIFEDIICHHYYNNIQGIEHVSLNGEIDEKMCKVDAIQAELAIVLGGNFVANAVPGMLLSFPWGLLGDRIGRKTVLGLAMLGLTLTQIGIAIIAWFWQTFPLRLIWATPIFQIIGGGGTIPAAMLYATISDISIEENRANMFFFLMCSALLGELIAPSVASYLMFRNPWIPMFSSMALLIFGSMCVLFIPETLHLRPGNGTVQPITPDSSSATSSYVSFARVAGLEEQTPLNKAKAWINKICLQIYDATSMFYSLPLVLLLLHFVLVPLNIQVLDLTLRIISHRFHWSLAESGFLMSLRASLNILVYVALMPSLSYVLSHTPSRTLSTSRHLLQKLLNSLKRIGFSLPSRTKDLYLARFSILISILGCAVLALSQNVQTTIFGLAFLTLGSGYQAVIRSLLSVLVDQEHIGRLFAAIAVIEMIGALIEGPGLAILYKIGLRKGGAWAGAPFWAVTAAWVVIGAGLWFVRLPKDKGVQVLEAEDQDEALLAAEEAPQLGK